MTQPTTLRMSAPGEFIAAVPALLGFYPVDSLVVALLERRPPADEVCIKVVARHDLHISDSRLTAVVTQLADVAANENASAVLVLVVDSTAQQASAPPSRAHPHPRHPRPSPHHTRCCSRLGMGDPRDRRRRAVVEPARRHRVRRRARARRDHACRHVRRRGTSHPPVTRGTDPPDRARPGAGRPGPRTAPRRHRHPHTPRAQRDHRHRRDGGRAHRHARSRFDTDSSGYGRTRCGLTHSRRAPLPARAGRHCPCRRG